MAYKQGNITPMASHRTWTDGLREINRDIKKEMKIYEQGVDLSQDGDKCIIMGARNEAKAKISNPTANNSLLD
jgi:hypothetical protein